MGTKLSMWFVILTVFLQIRSARSFEYQIHASVMGRLGSKEAELYANISEILLREAAYPERHAFCSVSFNQLTFDTTNGSTVYRSLTRARTNFDNIRHKAVAIGPAIDVFTSTDYVILNQLHLLTSISGLDPHMTSSGKRVVSIYPDPESLSTAVADVVHKLGWRKVALLAEDDFSPVLSLSRLGITVWPIRLPQNIASQNDVELISNLLQLRSSQRQKFILHSTSRSTVMHVMSAANRVHLLHHSLDWFITYPDFKDLLGSDDGKWPGSLYGLQLLRPEKIPQNISSHDAMIGVELSRLELAMAVDVVGLLRHVLWRAVPDCSVEPDQNSIVSSRDFERIILTHSMEERYEGALGLYAWSQDTNTRTNYSVDILWFKNHLNSVGTVYYMDSGLLVEGNFSREDDDSLQQVFGKEEHLKVVYQLADPFVMKRDDQFEGFTVDLLNELARKLNFQYQLVEAPTLQNKNGVDNGMIQELLAGNASLAIGALDVSAEREEVISFSYTILSTKASLLIKSAESGQNFFQFLGPFSTGLWFMILGFLVVAGASLYLMARFDQTQQGSEQRFDLKESAWYSINIILQGTTEYSPQTTSMRTIIAFFWFCVLIIDAAYTANLAAFLTLQQMDSRIRSVRELADQNTIMYGVQRGSSLETFFKNQTTAPFERMWTFMKINSDKTLVSDREEIISRVLSGKYVHIADGVVNNYYAGEVCGMEAVEQEFGGKTFSLGMPRGAPYKDDVNRALLKLKEEGVLDQLQDKWWSASRNCSTVEDKGTNSNKATAELDIANMFGVFIVLVAFTILAIIVEIVERVTHCVHQRRKKEVDAAHL